MAGLVLAAFVSVATAQPKPALVLDVDEPGRDPFMVTVDAAVGSDDCHQGGSTTNRIVFLGSLPAGKRLVIAYASALRNATSAIASIAGYFIAVP